MPHTIPETVRGPRIAVVVVTVNSRADAERNLGELGAQEGVELEIVFVDNGSTDGTLDVLEGRPDVTLIANGENRWLSPAWAQGVRASSAPFVLFLTPDVRLIDRFCLRRLHDALAARPRAALAGPTLADEGGRDLRNGAFAFPSPLYLALQAVGLSGVLHRDRLPPPLHFAGEEPRGVPFVNGCCMLVRREALEAIGGLDERYRLYWEEIDLARRLSDAGFEILLAPGVRAVHRGKGSPARERLREEAWGFGERLYVRKHHGVAADLLIRSLRVVERGRRALRRSARPPAGPDA